MATITVYPAAGAVSPVDGQVFRDITSETFSTIRTGAGTGAPVSQVAIEGGLVASATTNEFATLTRAIICFDTSSITSINRTEAKEFVSVSAASIAFGYFRTRADFSGASITGVGFSPVFRSSAAYSGPTTAIGGLLITPQPGTLQFVSVVTRTVASGASVVFDLKKNGASLFGASALPVIAGGGTFVSTASLGTKNVDAGDILQADVSAMSAGAGLITDVTLVARAY